MISFKKSLRIRIAVKSTDLKEYLPSRNEFRIAIIESKIPANEKNYYFTALTGYDIDFFNQNWKTYNASDDVHYIRRQYLAALIYAAKISDMQNGLEDIANHAQEDCPQIMPSAIITAEAETLLERANYLYKEIEKNYWDKLGFKIEDILHDI